MHNNQTVLSVLPDVDSFKYKENDNVVFKTNCGSLGQGKIVRLLNFTEFTSPRDKNSLAKVLWKNYEVL